MQIFFYSLFTIQHLCICSKLESFCQILLFTIHILVSALSSSLQNAIADDSSTFKHLQHSLPFI